MELPDLTATTESQQRAWSTGDFHRIGVSQVIVGELLVRALDLHAEERVLDVAGGAGNTALAAARRCADVVCTDYVPELLERARVRAAAEGLPLRTEVADAQDLPYPDGSFDVVTSTFGAMFAPDQERTADELLRVSPPGRPARHGELDARKLGRRAVRRTGPAPTAAARRPSAVNLGDRTATARIVCRPHRIADRARALLSLLLSQHSMAVRPVPRIVRAGRDGVGRTG